MKKQLRPRQICIAHTIHRNPIISDPVFKLKQHKHRFGAIANLNVQDTLLYNNTSYSRVTREKKKNCFIKQYLDINFFVNKRKSVYTTKRVLFFTHHTLTQIAKED